ncbi:hypothetical protein ACGCUQ_00610 [Eubacteriales bacterium KG127]
MKKTNKSGKIVIYILFFLVISFGVVGLFATDEENNIDEYSEDTYVSETSCEEKVEESSSSKDDQASDINQYDEEEQSVVQSEEPYIEEDYAENSTYNGYVVYITNTGQCYHRYGCGYLKSCIEISVDEAINRGYRPCTRCNP